MRLTEPLPHKAARPPRLNGRYLVSQILGKGAQARVYLAFDTRLRHWRAVKVLAPNYIDDEHVRARFEQEARAMAKLSHPNLLRVVDIDHDGRTPFMVMELARGGAVTEWMKRHGPVPPVLACRAAQRCCEGLAAAHAVGVVHRDVKPHNLLIREDASVALTDFGIAHVEENVQLTATGTIMGTFAFMAPEQRTDAKSVDLRADVYSLGATLYTMLTGRTSPELFFAESRDALLDGVPDVLRPIILTACRYEKEQRFSSMDEFRTALERKIARLPKDPGDPHFATALLPLPEGPPEWVEDNSGVEELRKVLTMEGEELPTVIPTSREPEPLGNTTHSTALPYRMPAQRSKATDTKALGSKAMGTLTREAGTGKPANGKGGYSPAGRGAWSVPPDFIDPGTVDAPLPGPAPRAALVVVEDESADGSVSRSLLRAMGTVRSPGPSLVAAGLLGLLALFVVMGMGGLVSKAFASRQLDVASRELVVMTNEEASVVDDLVAAGANEARLNERWTQFQEASSERQPAAASAFVEAVELEAARVHLDGLPVSHVTQLARARREWESAIESREWARQVWFARLTGEWGLW
jgi:serine/threonine protein kinase